jgi:hypothetical protein
LVKRAGVLDGLATVAVGRALEHAARPELLAEGLAIFEHHVAGVVAILGLFLGVEVVEVAEELIEAVHRRQVLVAVALVVLAELAGGVALALQHGGDRDVGLLPTLGAPGMPTLVMPERTGTCR